MSQHMHVRPSSTMPWPSPITSVSSSTMDRSMEHLDEGMARSMEPILMEANLKALMNGCKWILIHE